MLIDTLVGNPWLVAGLWGILSIFDFVGTMLYSKAYRESQHGLVLAIRSRWVQRQDRAKLQVVTAASGCRVFNIGVLYLVVYLMTGRLFFLGGGLICMFYALRHYLLSNRQLPKPISES